MELKQVLVVVAVISLWSTRPVLTQSPTTASAASPQIVDSMSFDVVSVRPSDPNHQQAPGLQFTDNGLHVTDFPLDVLIRIAYKAGFETKVQGLPGWTTATHYDIEARVGESNLQEYQKFVHDMTAEGQARRSAILSSLLAERFKLRAHREAREGTVYTLIVAKGGSKLQKGDDNLPPRVVAAQRGRLTVNNATIGATTAFLAQELGHSVTDKTGLTGRYNFTLVWASDRGTSSSGATSDTGPSIFTAVEEQLGLKLEATKGLVDTIIVDSIEKPSVN